MPQTIASIARSGVTAIAINFESLQCSFFAIKKIGLSLASALWSGVAILASFTWGLRRA